MIRKLRLLPALLLITAFFFYGCGEKPGNADMETLKAAFHNPPDSARPGVYWYFMDGNMSKEGMRKDLESMKKAGIGQVVFLEVNVGIPRGPVDYLGDEWLDLFAYAVGEAKRLGIDITLGVGPGWTGSGGPWVSPEASMQHLVSTAVQVTGPADARIQLPRPEPKKPYFGEGIFTPALRKQWEDFYEDVAVLAFPTPDTTMKLKDMDERALYYRAPYTSVEGVKPFLPSPAMYPDGPAGVSIPKDSIRDVTDRLSPDGTLHWQVPPGNWTVMRFGRRNNGAITRPAPVQGLGFECDKFDTAALDAHLNAYIGKILRRTGPPDTRSPGGLKRLHMDSWEMGAQNWTPRFREEFRKRRGYDPLPFYPVYAGNIVGSPEISIRFLWDLRQTCQELVLDYHARHLKKYAHKLGLGLSIEPYDMNPTADLELGAVADVPMCEFWSKGYGFNASFSCIEATSIAHVNGEPVVQAEAFTANGDEAWKQYPGSMKNQGDWAFALGINRLFYHTFEHKPLDDALRPGMTMGPYGVHWDRKQTWWPMAAGYHRYVSRCQFMLQQGKPVADILYLTPEGAPQVFLPPASALAGDPVLPDKKGYNFDGCAPGQLYTATVKDHRIVFPGGASYRLMVLPAVETMTPALLEKIRSLVKAGAVVTGTRPRKSPGLSGHPGCDGRVQVMAGELWGAAEAPAVVSEHRYGRGKVISGGDLKVTEPDTLYPRYAATAALLKKMGVPEDFTSSVPLRYHHRALEAADIYFVSNPTGRSLKTDCSFRTVKGAPELWDPLTGETRQLPEFSTGGERTTVPLQFAPWQSYFIVFSGDISNNPREGKNFPLQTKAAALAGPWTVDFDTARGGPGRVTFEQLTDWTRRPEKGIRYYSGMAVYRKDFDLPAVDASSKHKRYFLDLGMVKNMARVRLNGHDLGVLWTAPMQVDITDVVKQQGNRLEISVANLWPNRLIGDAQLPGEGIKNDRFPDWLLKGDPQPGNRYTFTTYPYYSKDDSLLSSGLLGPVTILQEDR